MHLLKYLALTGALAAFLAATLAVPENRSLAADQVPTTISEAPSLTWGFKQTWRNYAPPPATSGGATVGGAGIYNIQWPFESGTYDPATQTTHLNYKGSVHWQKYKASELDWKRPPGYGGADPDPYLLDVTMSAPQITISRDSSVLTVEISSRNKATWEMIEYGRIPLVDLEVAGATTTVEGGITQWSGITATVTEQGRPAFDNTYRVGQVVDSVSFSYTGPGGAPDFSEHFDQEGAPTLNLVKNELFIQGDAPVNLPFSWVDRGRLLVHTATAVTVDGVNSRQLETFDLNAMHSIGQPLSVPRAQFPADVNQVVAYDSNDNRLLYRSIGESGMPRWLKYDVDGQDFELGQFEDPKVKETSFMGSQKLAWDPTRDQGYRVQNVAGQWQLIVYAEELDGTWTKEIFPIPDIFGSGQTTGLAQETSFTAPRYATASDGSLIVLATARTSSDPLNPAPARIPAAYRIQTVDSDENVQIDPLPVDVPNASSTIFQAVQTSPNGHILLISTSGSGDVVHCHLDSVSGVQCDDPVSIRDNVEPPVYEESRFAIDPSTGRVWFGGVTTQKLAAIQGGKFLGAQFFQERSPKGGPILVTDNHFVYAQTNDGSPGELGGSKTWGYGKFELVGFVPTISSQPQNVSVVLGLGESSKETAFTSTAVGEPTPARQWQVKVPGSARFTDITGQNGETLSVETKPGMEGTEYRAIYENAAGTIASDPAVLHLTYAPRLVSDIPSVSVTEGSNAEFSVIPDANPEPEVTWERRVGGFWQPIDDDDSNFIVAEANLTVLDTNTDQSGALFRAKLVNDVGTAFSNPAKLTVTPQVSIPPGGLDLDNVSLDWSGNEEMQNEPPAGGSNYFSAGVSGGNEATYKSVDGNAAVYQVSSSGNESLATWSTRAAHIDNGGEQLVRLYGGEAHIEPDGWATVQWDGSFSVNFYGGLVPFTFTDPELTVDASGIGRLKAEMSGCASNIDNPSVCTPFAPVADVTVADFSGVEIDPSGEVTFTPKYAGVEVDDVDPTKPQVRTGTGWGSWPASFVSFHVQTGLAAYWYTSGSSFDPDKAPSPFVVDFQGDPAPSAPPPEEKSDTTPPGQIQPPTGGGQTQPPKGSTTTAKPVQPAAVKRTQKLGGRRVAKLATLSCPDGAACKVSAPKRVRAKIGKRRYPFVVLAPKRIGAGKQATLRLRPSKLALKVLGQHKRATTVKLRVRFGEQTFQVRVMLRGTGKARAKVVHIGVQRMGGDGSNPRHEIDSAPISGEAGLLTRPPTAVDVSGVQIAWYPRDSWLRYASSGVAPGDGIHIENGAAATNSTASACPDRSSTSDARLPYTINFTPKASWYDPASGIAGIYGRGSVNFRWKAHTIDLTASDPEIEINGTSSRAIFRFSGSEGTPYPNQRADLMILDTTGKPTVTNGGKTLTYDLMRGRLTPNGENVFAGFYTAPDNNEFGCASASFTLP